MPEGHRPAPHLLDVEQRIGSFDEVAQVMTEEEAMAEAGRCLVCGTCSECGLCEEACVAKAIDHNMPERERVLDVGSVILAPGFDQFEAEEIGEYGYGRWQNVITSMDFERMLSATGPSEGHVARISDGVHPHKIAWIQCVGSRDKRNDRNYCSAVVLHVRHQGGGHRHRPCGRRFANHHLHDGTALPPERASTTTAREPKASTACATCAR